MKSVAKWLRKLADFIDPRVKPTTDPLTITINCDTSQAISAIEDVSGRLARLGAALSVVRGQP